MSKLGNLVGKPKAYKIGELDLEFKPRTMKDIDLIMDLAEPTKRATSLKELIIRTLKEAVPDATDDEISQIAFKYFRALTEAIMDVNGLKENASTD